MNNKIELARYYDENEGLVTVTIENYNNMVAQKDKEKIADFIYNRLYSRYIKPFEYQDEERIYQTQYKNGFSMMANCCLLIETFQSFKENKNNEEAFQSFFENNIQFEDFKTLAELIKKKYL